MTEGAFIAAPRVANRTGVDAAHEAKRLRHLAAETGDLRFFRAAEALDAPPSEGADLVGHEVLALKAICAAAGLAVSVHGTVSEAAAAKLLERSKRTIEAWRYEGKGPPCTPSGSRIRYALRDLAIWRIRSR